MKTSDDEPVRITLRLPKELHKKADETAKKDRRSLNSIIEIALEEYLGVSSEEKPAPSKSRFRKSY